MLGKTNILATKESSIITDIEEFHWKAVNISSEGLVRAIYNENTGTMVVVASGGTVLWSLDGEIWESKTFEDTTLTDVIWDGSRYVFVGSETDGSMNSPLIMTSADLTEFNRIVKTVSSVSESKYYRGIYYKNGEYTVVCCTRGSSTGGHLYAYKYTKEFDSYTSCSIWDGLASNDFTQINMAKSTDGFLLGVKMKTAGGSKQYRAFVDMTQSGMNFTQLATLTESDQYWDTDRYYVFECKGELYYSETADTYRINKIQDMSSTVAVSAGKPFLFRTGIYLNDSRLFFNSHEMLVLKKSEAMADKEMEDLVEVSYEHSISQAIKAWEKIVLLCENGNILISSAETEDPGAVVVKTLSAKQALHEAKAYTEARVEEIMDGVSLSITEEGNLVARKGERIFQISATEI